MTKLSRKTLESGILEDLYLTKKKTAKEIGKELGFSQSTISFRIRELGLKKTLHSVCPELAKEWHPTKNDPHKPEDFTPKSSRKIWWRCKENHTWIARIDNRSSGKGCPKCSGRVASKTFLDLTKNNPSLLKEFSPKNPFNPTKDLILLNEEIIWICSNKHEFSMNISKRLKGLNCYYCSNQKLKSGYNDLTTKNPEIMKFWSFEKNKVDPKQINVSYNQIVYWRGDCGHLWRSKIQSMIHSSACPYCSNKKLLKKFNDLATRNPELVKEWSENGNGGLTPNDFLTGSNTLIWWNCSQNHEWKTSIQNRVRGTKCPACSRKEKRSAGEKEVGNFLEKIYSGKIMFNNRKLIDGLEVDILIPDLKIGIEYNGDYWHSLRHDKNALFRHRTKKELIEKQNFSIFFIWDTEWREQKNRLKRDLKKVIDYGEVSPRLTQMLPKNERNVND